MAYDVYDACFRLFRSPIAVFWDVKNVKGSIPHSSVTRIDQGDCVLEATSVVH